MPRLIAIVLAAFLGSAHAASRVVVLPFAGPSAAVSHQQIAIAVCDAATCLPQAKAGKSPKPDWKKLKKEKVDYAVTGSVGKVKKKLALDLSVWKGPGKPKLKKSFALDAKGRLSDTSLESATQVVLKALGVSAERKEPEPVAKAEPPPPDPAAAPEPPPEPTPARREPERAPEPARAEPTPGAEAPAAEVAQPAEEPRRSRRKDTPLFVLEAGPDLYTRKFEYTGLASKNLRTYSAPLIAAPRIHAELYPLAALTKGVAAGLGLDVGYAFAVGLQSQRQDSPKFPTKATRLDLGLKLRIRPVAGSEGAIVPAFGYRSASFAVSPAADGTVLDGLPGISYSALMVGLGGEVPVADNKLVVFARFAYLPVLSSGEIISATYFQKGSASGIEAALGAGFKVGSGVELRLTGQLTRYGLTFESQPTDSYLATGASDLNIGGNVSVRYTY